ncbi:amidohydrolase family protein [Streptomyces sp. NRRL S-813]|nr:amidohydrolase family protein [Streptomyces sp. NRRL S-813]
MVAAGMTPAQVLTAGTSGAARQCLRPDLGTVAPGKRADLLVLKGDPTADISNIRDLSIVILNGALAVDKRQEQVLQ